LSSFDTQEVLFDDKKRGTYVRRHARSVI